jgi:eukaryotic-like serine/threonine-protein kinase
VPLETNPRAIRSRGDGGRPFTIASVPLDTSTARSFFQQRLVTLVAMICVFVTSFFTLGPLLAYLLDRPSAEALLRGTAVLLYAPLSVALLAGWLFLRRSRLALEQLVLVDAALTVGCGAAFATMMYFTEGRYRAEFGHVLAITHVLVARAALIPSGAMRTVALGAFATMPLVLVTYEVHARGGSSADVHTPLFSMAVAMSWSLLAVAASWVVSRVVYGLHEKVREAMQLGQYVVEHKLGEGGMGIVFKAHHAMLRRPTAIKLLPPEKAGAENLARFEKEVQLTATLTHPNVIAVYDYGKTPEGVLYYAMEYVEGMSLQALIEKSGPLPAGRVIHLLRQVCGALYEAHCAGLVHRDVKPANILVSRRGQLADFVKVVDFGLVKQVGGASGKPLSDGIAGTPLYLSPEAILSPPDVAAPADLYALGAVGYFLLTGTTVFQGRSAVELCNHHLRSPPDPPGSRVRHPVPPDLAAVLMRCLEKDPAQRPADARQLGELLGACSDAGAWTEADASAWWTKDAARLALQVRASAAKRSEPAFPMPVDVRDRLVLSG